MQNKVSYLEKLPLKALIIEDSDDDAELLVHQLIRGGYDLVFERVQTEGQMQDALVSQSWDIVISDYQLPTFSAPAALACLRRHALDLPFIVVSGVIDEETSVKILSAGAHDFILKGRWSRLIPAIQREVREAKERQARFAAEQAARIAAEQYRVIFETIGTPIFILDKKLRVLLANTPVLQLVGVEEREIIGNRSWMNYIDPTDLRQIANQYLKQINTNLVDHTSYEARIVDKRGVNRVVVGTIAIVPGTDTGIISLLDVTETRRTEQAIRESEDLYRALFENNHSAFVLFNPANFAIIDANHAACNYYGYHLDELRSMKVNQLTLREPYDLEQLFWKIQGNQITRYESKHRLASGEIREVEVFSGPLQRDGHGLILSVIHDITERKVADIALRRRAEELAALHAIAVAGAEAFDENILITRATQIISQTFFSDMIGVLLLNSDGEFLIPHPSYYGITEEKKNNRIALRGSVSGKVVTSGLPICLADVSNEPEYFEASPTTKSELCVPLKISNRVIGIINLESVKLDAYHDADLHLLTTIAGQLATAIERLRTESAEREQARQLSTIFEIGQEIVSARLDSDQVYIAIHKAVSRLMPCEAFVIVRLDQIHEELVAVYAWDRGGKAPTTRLPLESGISGYVIKNGKSILLRNLSESETLTKMVYFGDSVHTESNLVVPLRLGDQTIGSLSVQSYLPDQYNTMHLHLLELFASYAAVALDNTRLFDETHQQAYTFENLFDAVILTNSRGMITGWNNAAEELFGYTKDETIGMSPHYLFSFNDEEYTAYITKVFTTLKTQDRWSGEVDFLRKDKSHGTAEIVILAVWDEKKGLIGGIFVYRDITDRRLAELSIKESEARFRNTFEQAAVGIAHTSLNGTFLKINQRFCDILGYTQEEMLRRQFSDITYPDDLQASVENLHQLVNGESQTYKTEKRYLRKDGSLVWTQLTVSLVRDSYNNLAYFIPVVEDITQRKIAEEEITRLISTFNQTGESILITDLDGIITYANPANELNSGYALAEIIGKKPSLFKSGIHDQDFYAQLWNTIIKGESWKGTITNRRKDGGLFHEDVVIFPVRDQSGKTINFAAVKRDISDRIERVRNTQIILDFTSELRSLSDLSNVVSLSLDRISKILNVKQAAFILLDESGTRINFIKGWGGWQNINFRDQNFINKTSQTILLTGKPFNSGASSLLINPVDYPEYILSNHAIGLPLKAQDKPVGVLWVVRKEKFNRTEENLLVPFTEIIGNAIYRTIMFEKAQHQASQLNTISALGRELSEILEILDIYPAMAKAVKALLPDSSSLLISMYETKAELITAVYFLEYGKTAQAGSLGWLPLDPSGREVQSNVILSRQPLIEDAVENKAWKQIHLGPIHENTCSIMLVPMQAKGLVLGVLQVQSPIKNNYHQPEAELLSLIGNTAAIAIDNARLFAENQLQIQRQSAIHAIDTSIISRSSLKASLNVVVEQTVRQLGVHAADVLLFDLPSNKLIYEIGCGFNSPPLAGSFLNMGEGSGGKVAIGQAPILINDLINSPWRYGRGGLISRESFKTYYGVPLIVKGQIKGVLEIFHRDTLNLHPDTIEFINILANQAALAIENSEPSAFLAHR